MSTSRPTRALAIAATVALGLVLAFGAGRQTSSPGASPDHLAQGAPDRAATTGGQDALPAPASARGSVEQVAAPVNAPIRALHIEPQRVCARQSFTATAEVDPAVGAAEVWVQGEPGRVVSLTAREPGTMRVLVTLRRTPTAEPELLAREITVHDCPDAPRISLTRRAATDADDAVRFEARAEQGLVAPITWRWRFGDGATRTAGARVTHSYKLRPQRARQSTFVAQVTARDAMGQEARASVNVVLANGAWLLAQRGIWSHPVQTARFPEVKADALRSPLRLRNLSAEHDLELDTVRVKATSCDDPNRTMTTTLRPHDALGFDLVRADEIAAGTMTIPIPQGRWCRWRVEAVGTLADGTPSTTAWSLERGAPSWAEPMTDREAIKRAFRARVLARKRHLTGQELRDAAANPTPKAP